MSAPPVAKEDTNPVQELARTPYPAWIMSGLCEYQKKKKNQTIEPPKPQLDAIMLTQCWLPSLTQRTQSSPPNCRAQVSDWSLLPGIHDAGRHHQRSRIHFGLVHAVPVGQRDSKCHCVPKALAFAAVVPGSF